MRNEFAKQCAVLEHKRNDERDRDALLALLLILMPSMIAVMRRHLLATAGQSMNRALEAMKIKDGDKRLAAMADMDHRIADRIEWAANEINETTADELEAAIAEALPGMEDEAITSVFERATTERSMLIGSTESVFAFHAGILSAAEQSDPPVLKRWVTQDGACPACLALEDEGAIPLEKLFGDEFDAPPVHPNCRCSIELEYGT